ncbi:MAG: hypothetical protein DRI23_03950 [Candidatus Cloacimonadota bacterium]|nr:MAG: hypothetical protein DRI23_03950 [Candidatus Cloacimonadota bacterium]
MNVDKLLIKFLKSIIVHKATIKNSKSTNYTLNGNVCNGLKYNKIKSIFVSYNHIHSNYCNY